MLTQGRFLISYQIFDNIPVNNNGQTHVREILKDTQAFTFSYRTEHQDIIVIDLKKHLKSFIQDKDQAEEMITQYTCYYNAIKRWESNHKETEILHQLEISNLLEQLKNN